VTPAASLGPRRYVAFISYRHKPLDIAWAKWLHNEIERFRVPSALVKEGYPPRLRPVFRDQEDLPVDANLSKSLEVALEGSGCLVVVCSPRTPESVWVRQEIEQFRKLGRGDRILALLIEGEPEQSFPEPLRFVDREVLTQAGERVVIRDHVEPLAADVRPGGGQEASTRVRNRKALVRVVAAILGVGFDELWQREARRRRRVMQTWIAGVAAVMMAMAGLTGAAVWQRGRAVENAAEAQRQATIASENEEIAKRNEQRAVQERLRAGERLLISEAGAKFEKDPGVMRLLLRELPTEPQLQFPTRVRAEWLLSSDDRLKQRAHVHAGSVNVLTISSDGRLAASGGAWGEAEDYSVRVWPVDDPGNSKLLGLHTNDVNFARWSTDGARLVTASEDEVKLWHLSSGESIEWKDLGVVSTGDRFSSEIDVSSDGRKIAVFDGDNIVLLNAEKPGEIVRIECFGNISSLQWRPGTDVLTFCDDNMLRSVRSSGLPVTEIFSHGRSFDSFAWSPNGDWLAYVEKDNANSSLLGGKVFVASTSRVANPIPLYVSSLPVLNHRSWSSDSKLLCIYTSSGEARIFGIEDSSVFNFGAQIDSQMKTFWDLQLGVGGNAIDIGYESVISGYSVFNTDRHKTNVMNELFSIRTASSIEAVRFGESGIVCGFEDGTVRVFSFEGKSEPSQTISTMRRVRHSQVDQKANRVLFRDWRSDRISVNTIGGSEFQVTLNESERATVTSWSPDGRFVALGFHDGRVRTWNSETGGMPEWSRQFESEGGWVDDIVWHPASACLAVKEHVGNKIVILEETNAMIVATLKSPVSMLSTSAPSWSSDGKWLVSGLIKGGVCVWSANDWNVAHVAGIGKYTLSHRPWSPCGRYLCVFEAMDDSRALVFLDSHNGFVPVELAGVEGTQLQHVSWSPDAKWMVQASNQNQTLIRIDSSIEKRELSRSAEARIGWFSWSDDGTVLAGIRGELTGFGGDREVEYWGLGRNSDLRERQRIIEPSVTAWAPDSARFSYSLGTNKVVCLRAGDTNGRSLITFPETMRIDMHYWSADGRRIVAIDDEGEVSVALVDWADIRRMLWHSTNAYLFASERMAILGEDEATAKRIEAEDRAWIAEKVAAEREGRPLPEPPVTPRR
jgi:WD40 repeat protein